jgi:uncharacterized protein (UPF0335 family)
MTATNGQLKSFIERIERLNEEKKAISDDCKAVYDEAKSTGLNVKILRKVIAIRKIAAAELQEQETMIDLYLFQIGGAA